MFFFCFIFFWQKTNKGACDVKMVRTFNDSTCHNIRKVINTIYYKSCDTWKYPIVGVIPKEQHCCDCKNCTRVSVNYQYLVFLFIFYFIFLHLIVWLLQKIWRFIVFQFWNYQMKEILAQFRYFLIDSNQYAWLKKQLVHKRSHSLPKI